MCEIFIIILSVEMRMCEDGPKKKFSITTSFKWMKREDVLVEESIHTNMCEYASIQDSF